MEVDHPEIFLILSLFLLVVSGTGAVDIFLEWNVSFDWTVKPVFINQPVITINGMFPGPLINSTTNDIIHANVFNNLDEPMLMTWNGIQQRLNSWQDGVSGTNCPIEPGTNWTYVFQVKDQIGSFFYFPSINFQKAAGRFGPIRVNNRNVILVPFPKPDAEFDLLIGDWYSLPYKNHQMILVETEGSYTNQILLDSLDVHVGQSYSVLFTASQQESDYYIVASPTQIDTKNFTRINGVAVLHYSKSSSQIIGDLPPGPDQLDRAFSIDQAKSIRWNMTAGAARPNPQGTFNVTNITLSQTFIPRGIEGELGDRHVYTINNLSYVVPSTPLKLADFFVNGSGVYQLDSFPVQSTNWKADMATSVVSGTHKGWIEIVFENKLDVMDAWHLDGFGFYVVGFGDGEWSTALRETYNLFDPVVRSTIQVYPGGWSAVYAFLDNPGMWNLRSQRTENWYLGQEIYLRVHDDDPNPDKERPPPENLLLCGMFSGNSSGRIGLPAPGPEGL